MIGLSVKGMHVEVIAQLQRQGAYRKDRIFEQQIDWRLTSAQNILIKNKIKPSKDQQSPKFEMDQKAVTDIQSVIVSNKELRIIKATDTRGYVQLPYDFGYLVNDRSNVVEDCKTTFTTPTPTEAYTYQIRAFNFGESQKTATPYYQQVRVTKQSANKDLPVTTGLASKKDKDWLINSIIGLFAEHGYDAYWENFGDTYRANSFLVVVTALSDTISITIDGTTKEQDEIISKTVTRYIENTGEEVPNRCYKNDYVYDALASAYMKSIPSSPVSSLAKNTIFVHTSKKFLVSKIFIDYIRTPRPISLYLNSSCELHPNTHQEVCDVAVELLKRDIESTTYGEKIQENVLRNQH